MSAGSIGGDVRARVVSFRGKDQDLRDLCRRFGIDVRTAECRMARGMTAEQCFEVPVRRYPETKRRRAQWPPQWEASPAEATRTLPDQLLQDAEDLLRECVAVLRDSPLSSRRQTMAQAHAEDWLRRRTTAARGSQAAAR